MCTGGRAAALLPLCELHSFLAAPRPARPPPPHLVGPLQDAVHPQVPHVPLNRVLTKVPARGGEARGQSPVGSCTARAFLLLGGFQAEGMEWNGVGARCWDGTQACSPVAAQQLQRVVCDVEAGVGRKPLGHSAIQRRPRAAAVQRRRRVAHHQAGRLQRQGDGRRVARAADDVACNRTANRWQALAVHPPLASYMCLPPLPSCTCTRPPSCSPPAAAPPPLHLDRCRHVGYLELRQAGQATGGADATSAAPVREQAPVAALPPRASLPPSSCPLPLPSPLILLSRRPAHVPTSSRSCAAPPPLLLHAAGPPAQAPLPILLMCPPPVHAPLPILPMLPLPQAHL